MNFNQGDRVRNRRGRVGEVVGYSGGPWVRIRYDDGIRDTWIEGVNLTRERSEP